jgi:hypothetical protein
MRATESTSVSASCSVVIAFLFFIVVPATPA